MASLVSRAVRRQTRTTIARPVLRKRRRATIVLDPVDRQLMGVKTAPRETFLDAQIRALSQTRGVRAGRLRRR